MIDFESPAIKEQDVVWSKESSESLKDGRGKRAIPPPSTVFCFPLTVYGPVPREDLPDAEEPVAVVSRDKAQDSLLAWKLPPCKRGSHQDLG